MMARAIRLHETGGPELLKLETVELGEPGRGQARVRHSYVAVNFIDIYFRTGRYPMPLPNGLGSDAVGVDITDPCMVARCLGDGPVASLWRDLGGSIAGPMRGRNRATRRRSVAAIEPDALGFGA